jgi:hypothetical protein
MSAITHRAQRWPGATLTLGLLLLVALVYWPGLGGGYVFDDFPNLVDNTALHVTTLDLPSWLAATLSSPASDLQRPLAMLSFALNHYFTGLDPMPMKATNLAIHLLNAWLVLVLVRRLLSLCGDVGAEPARRAWTARFVAAAWALHPLNLMGVLFIVQRMESLSHVFVFAGLSLYLLGRQRQLAGRPGWLPILAGLCGGTVLGALAKESAVLLPLYALLLETCLPALRGRGHARALHWLFVLGLGLPAVLGVAWLLPKALAPAAYAIRDFDMGERLLTEARVVLDYLRWSLLPSLGELSLYHDDYRVSRGLLDPPSTAFALAALAALAASAGWLRARRPLLALGLLWFLAAHALTATFLPLELVYEHRNYFASLGICLALGDVLLLAPRAQGARRIGVLVAALGLLAFAATTHLRAREWSDPYRFASSEAAKHPDSPRATYALAQVLVRMSDYDRNSPWLPAAREALERARATPRSGILPQGGLLLVAANTGSPQRDVWWSEMEAKLAKGPVGPQEIAALASLVRCARSGACRFDDARLLASIEAAERHGPQPDLLTLHGDYLLNVRHDAAAAEVLWRQAVALRPGQPQYRINLIRLLVARGLRDEAERELAALQALGHFGQTRAAAEALRRQIDALPR